MSSSLAEIVMMNVSKMHAGHISMERNASSLSTVSSEFEFDSCSFSEINDEAPVSPKLLYSPTYSPNYSPNGQRPLMVCSNQFSAERDMHASRPDHVEQQVFDDRLPYKAPPSVSSIKHESADTGEEKKRMNLRSLLIRRDLEQQAPLIGYHSKSNHQINKKDIKKQVALKRTSRASTPSSSASPSSPSVNHANSYTHPCKLENYHPDYAGDASPTESKSSQKKSTKWAFKLDFLRKGSIPKAEEGLNQRSKDKKADYSLNHGVFSNQRNHCSISAAAEEPRVDVYLHERDHAVAAAGEGSDYQLNHRIDRYRAAEAAGEARFNHQINQRIDNYRGAAALISKLESSRQSTSSVISSVNSSPRCADSEIIKANHRKISKSAPISPAASPPRSLHEEVGELTRGRAPMSPHAFHYQQQRARTEELRRKAFLPYRQSVLGAWFSPLSQAVY